MTATLCSVERHHDISASIHNIDVCLCRSTSRGAQWGSEEGRLEATCHHSEPAGHGGFSHWSNPPHLELLIGWLDPCGPMRRCQGCRLADHHWTQSAFSTTHLPEKLLVGLRKISSSIYWAISAGCRFNHIMTCNSFDRWFPVVAWDIASRGW